ncbi:MAG: hypothetical protein UZ08_BCD001002506, partial [Candidatus Parvibacillus calidus]
MRFLTINKSGFFLSLLFICIGSIGFSQPNIWNYDFGTTTGSFTTNNSNSTTFLNDLAATPTAGGTYRVRTSNGQGGGFFVQDATVPGSGHALDIQASSGGSTNKFGVYDWNNPSPEFYLKAKVRTTSSNTGQLNISVGLPAVGNDNNGYTGHYNNVLANFTIVYDASGVITSLKRRSLGSDVNITSGIPFSEDANQTIEIYCNNRSTANTYRRGGNTYNLDPQKWDLWVDGTLVLDDAARGNSLGANANISAFAFFAESSASNSAHFYIDDLEYHHALPKDSYNYTWASPVNGNWNDPGKWIPYGVPDVNDNAIISNASTVTLTSAIQLHDLTLGHSSSKILGSYNIDLSGDLSFTNYGGTLANDGDVSVAGDVVFNLLYGSHGNIGDGTTGGDVTVAGSFNVMSGNGIAYIKKKTVILNGGGTLNNHLYFRDKGTLILPSGKTLTSVTPGGYVFNGLSNSDRCTFINYGTFVRAGSGTLESNYLSFQNHGNVQLTTGDWFQYYLTGSSDAGNFDIATGRTLGLVAQSDSTYTLGGTTTISGNGLLQILNGGSNNSISLTSTAPSLSIPNLKIGGVFTSSVAFSILGNLEFYYSSGRLEVPFDLSIGGDLSFTNYGGTLANDGDVSVAGDVVFNLLYGSHGNIGDGTTGGDVTVAGSFNVMSGNGIAYIKKKTVILNGGGTLNNHLYFRDKGTLILPSGKTLTSVTPGGYVFNGLSNSDRCTFINYGTFVRAGSGTLESNYLSFQNHGNVQLTTGDWFQYYLTGSSDAGNFDIATGRTLGLVAQSDSTYTLGGTTTISGNGLLQILNGGSNNSISLTSTAPSLSIPNLKIGGVFTSSVAFSILGNLEFYYSSGRLEVPFDLSIGGDLSFTNYGGTLANDG